MTLRENMRRAVEFRTPEWLPINGYGETGHTEWVPTEQILPPQALAGRALDQWLCRWEKSEVPNMGLVRGHPLEDWNDLADYPWPQAGDPRRYAKVPAFLEALEADPARAGKYRICSIFMLLWERMQALHGLENCMVDMLDDIPHIHELADRLVDYDITFIREMHRIAGSRIDAFNFTEDWGSETALMVSPSLFRSFFLPRYKRIFAAAHDCGWHVWMHSCGRINQALPLLIEAGVDIINMQQPLVNGIEEIGAELAGRICFETLCDIQRTLPKGDLREIEEQAVALMNRWGTPRGGFILGDYGDPVAIGANPHVKQAMLELFRQHDPWRQAAGK